MIDGANPKLNWDNEQRAVKQNMNLVFNMLLGMGAAGIAVVFLIFVSSSMIVTSLVFIIGLLAANFGLYKLLEKRFPKMLERIE
jgi:ABC-2 type transport system permease protein